MIDLKSHKKPIPEYFIALLAQREQKADVEKRREIRNEQDNHS